MSSFVRGQRVGHSGRMKVSLRFRRWFLTPLGLSVAAWPRAAIADRNSYRAGKQSRSRLARVRKLAPMFRSGRCGVIFIAWISAWARAISSTLNCRLNSLEARSAVVGCP
jgi:hypothetical protein